MPSFFSKLLGKKKHSDNSGLLDGERYEAIPPRISPPPATLPENESSSKSPHKSKSYGLGLNLKRRAASPPPPPEREPVAPAPLLSLDLPASKPEEKQAADLDLGILDTSSIGNEAILRKKRLTPAETLYLVQKTSEIISERGLEVLGVMRPHWFASPNHHEAQFRLLNRFLQSLATRSFDEVGTSSVASEDPFENELRYTRDPHDVAAVFRWGLRHLQLENNAFALTTVQDWYQAFVTSERSEGYPPQAFDRILSPLLPNTHVQLIRAVLDLISSLAAHSEENGISGNKLSKALGWWLISSRNVKDFGWPSFYSDWESAARQFEHLFLAYIRTQGTQSRMPKRLIELVKNYPFEKYRKPEDGIFLPRIRFSTRTTDALFVRIVVQESNKTTFIHPLQIIVDSLNSFPDKDVSGDYLAIWESIRGAAKTNTEEENQDNSSAKFNLSAVFADESLRLLSLIPGTSNVPDVITFPTRTSQRSFSLVERPLSLVSNTDQKSTVDKAHSPSMTNLDLDHVTDWQAFSTTGFRSPSGISLSAPLWDNDVEITTPPMRRNGTRHALSFSSSSDPPPAEEPSAPLQATTAVEQDTIPVEISASHPVTFSSPSLVKLDEAFVDFWADTLLDSVAQSWPTFVVCQLKPMSNLKVKDSAKTIEWIVIERVVDAPALPTKEAEPEHLPVAPSTPTKADSHKPHGLFSFTSPGRKRWSLFSSKHDTVPLGRRRSSSKVSEVGEILKEEDETPNPPSDVSMTAPQSEESTSAVGTIPKLEPLQEATKSDEPVSEEQSKTDQLSPIQEEVKIEEAAATETKSIEPESVVPKSLPPVPTEVETEEVVPEPPSKEHESLSQPVVRNQVEEGETLADSRVESDAVMVDSVVPLGESAVIVPKPEEKALPSIDEPGPSTETPLALESVPTTEESTTAAIQDHVQNQSIDSAAEQEVLEEPPAVHIRQHGETVPAETSSANTPTDSSGGAVAALQRDEGLKLDTAPAPHSDVSVSVIEPTPIEESMASMVSPVAMEPVIEPIREEDEYPTSEIGKEGGSQGFEYIAHNEPAEAKAVEESFGTLPPIEEESSDEASRALEPINEAPSTVSQGIMEVSEEPSSLSGQQVGEAFKDEILQQETLPSTETALVKDPQTTLPEFSEVQAAPIEGNADEVSRLPTVEEAQKTEEAEISAAKTSMETPAPSAEENVESVTPEPSSAEKTLSTAVHEASDEVAPTSEIQSVDEISKVPAVTREESSLISNEGNKQSGDAGATADSSLPEAIPVTETLASDPGPTTVESFGSQEDNMPVVGEIPTPDVESTPTIVETERSAVHDEVATNIAPAEESKRSEETSMVENSAIETIPPAESADIPEDTSISPGDGDMSGETVLDAVSTVDKSLPAAGVDIPIQDAQQPNDLETAVVETSTTAEPAVDLTEDRHQQDLPSVEPEKAVFSEETSEPVGNEEKFTTTDIPIIHETTAVQIPIIEPTQEIPDVPVAEVVSVPKVAILGEEETSQSETKVDAVVDDNKAEEPDEHISNDEEAPTMAPSVAKDTAVIEGASNIVSSDNFVSSISHEKVQDDAVNVQTAGSEAKSHEDMVVPRVEEPRVDGATMPASDVSTEEPPPFDNSIQGDSIEQYPVTADEKLVAEESLPPSEPGVQPPPEAPVPVGQDLTTEEPSIDTAKEDSTEVLVPMKEPSISAPAPDDTSLHDNILSPHSNGAVDLEKAKLVDEPVTQIPRTESETVISVEAGAIPETPVGAISGLKSEPEAVSESVEPTGEVPVAEAEESATTGLHAAVPEEPQGETIVAEPAVPEPTSSVEVQEIEEEVEEPEVEAAASKTVQPTQHSINPAGEFQEEPENAGFQAKFMEPVDVAEVAKPESEDINRTNVVDSAGGEVQPDLSTQFPTQSTENTGVVDSEALNTQAAATPEVLEPLLASRVDTTAGEKEDVPAQSSVLDIVSPSNEESEVSKDHSKTSETRSPEPTTELETAEGTQTEPSAPVLASTGIDPNQSQPVGPTDNTVPATEDLEVDSSLAANPENVDTSASHPIIPIIEEEVASQPTQAEVSAPVAESAVDGTDHQTSLLANGTSTSDSLDSAAIPPVNVESDHADGLNTTTEAEILSQSVQADAEASPETPDAHTRPNSSSTNVDTVNVVAETQAEDASAPTADDAPAEGNVQKESHTSLPETRDDTSVSVPSDANAAADAQSTTVTEDASSFVENVDPEVVETANENTLIPNPEEQKDVTQSNAEAEDPKSLDVENDIPFAEGEKVPSVDVDTDTFTSGPEPELFAASTKAARVHVPELFVEPDLAAPIESQAPEAVLVSVPDKVAQPKAVQAGGVPLTSSNTGVSEPSTTIVVPLTEPANAEPVEEATGPSVEIESVVPEDIVEATNSSTGIEPEDTTSSTDQTTSPEQPQLESGVAPALGTEPIPEENGKEAVEAKQGAPEAEAEAEGPVSAEPEVKGSDAVASEDEVKDISIAADVKAKNLPDLEDAAKAEVMVEGADHDIPSNGTIGTNGVVVNGSSANADTEEETVKISAPNQEKNGDYSSSLGPDVLKEAESTRDDERGPQAPSVERERREESEDS